jgi:hypothetical protein
METKPVEQSSYDLAEQLIMGQVSTDQCFELICAEQSLKFALDLKFLMYMRQQMRQNICIPEYEKFFETRIKDFNESKIPTKISQYDR